MIQGQKYFVINIEQQFTVKEQKNFIIAVLLIRDIILHQYGFLGNRYNGCIKSQKNIKYT